MKTPSKVNATVNFESSAHTNAQTCPGLGLQMLFLDEEQKVQTLIAGLSLANPVAHIPKPKYCSAPDLWVRYDGRSTHGKFYEIATTGTGVPMTPLVMPFRYDSYLFLVDWIGNVSPMAWGQERGNASIIQSAIYDEEGDITELDLERQASLTKKATRWLMQICRAYEVKEMPTREYRADWHNSTRASMQVWLPYRAPEAKPVPKQVKSPEPRPQTKAKASLRKAG